MDTTTILWISLIGMFAVMTGLYLLHLRIKDAGLVDLGWTGGVGLVTVILAVYGDGWIPRRILVAAMVVLWSARLFSHILKDRIMGKTEDPRYRSLRKYWGDKANRNFFWVFQLQSILVILFVLPVFALTQTTSPGFSVWDYAGVFVWFAAVAGESVADRQLALFRSDTGNRGQVCNKGLWRYSRHPNYFFEWLQWCAYVLMGIGHPMGWLTIIGPVLMWVFLWNFTGIPYTEKRAIASRGEAYRKYQQTTHVFFPWFPKHSI